MKLPKKRVGVNLFVFLLAIVFLACSKSDDTGSAPDPGPNPDPGTGTGEVGTLTFTPNESFFSPVGTLTANQRDKNSGNIYNKFEYYDYIYDWKVLTDTIVYGIDIKTAGNVSIKPEIGVPAGQAGSKMLIYIDNTAKEITLTSTGSESTYQVQGEVTFSDVPVGFHEIKLQLKTIEDPTSTVGHLKNVILTGTAIKDAENVMRRYRANAVHCKWQTDSNNAVEISVHELTIKSTDYSFYQPITTPFGYTGSTWDKDTQTFGGYNFSLWSYGANDPVPPFYQESHLIAVGPNLEFGTYGHEGTGVKPRGDHPYIGIDTNIQTIAVRKVPGEKYDTYWSYYLDPNDGHWKLYGCGKKYNESGSITGLNTGAFVEVPGAASKARAGHRTCETLYRGWQLDTSGAWHPINTMVGTTGQNNESFRDWNIVGNKFSMKMGGWEAPGIEKKTLSLNSPDPTPDYLQGAYLDELYQMPAKFTDIPPTNILTRSATINFNVIDLGTSASAELFWGIEEGLTKEDKWTNKTPFSIQSGENTIQLDNLIPNTKYYYRIKIVNNEGITWSFDTQEFSTLEEPAIVPVASFTASTTNITQGSAVSFTDTSVNFPNSWTWTIEGGTPSSSSEQNPVVSYNTPGVYAVSLTVSNTAGSNTVTQTNFITVTEGTSSIAPQVHYNFDGNLNDSSSNNRPLSEVGSFTANYTTDRTSNTNSAYLAPGDGTKYLENNYKGIGGNAKRTVTGWFKTTDAGTRKTIVSWGQNNEGQMFNIMIHSGRIRIEAGSCSLRGTASNLDDNTWHHIAVTYDPVNGDKLKDVIVYVDGFLDTNTPDGDGNSYRSEVVAINTDINTFNMRIGASSYSDAYYWRGDLDDIRVYDIVLTPEEILAMAQ